MDEHEHYGPGQPMNAADVAAIIAERDRLRTAFDRIALDPAEYRHALGHIADCDHNCDQCRQLAWQALDGGVDAQERATDILAERDRLRAVVDAVLIWQRQMADLACAVDVLHVADLYRILAGPALDARGR